MKFIHAIFFILTLATAGLAQTETQAEVVVPNTFIRKAPNTGGEKLGTVQRGDRFSVDKTRDGGGWYYVVGADGKLKGWINANTVRLSTIAGAAENSTAARSGTKAGAGNSGKANTASGSSGVAKGSADNAARPAAVSPDPNASSEPEEVVRVETEEIILNVRVVDSANRPVKNLNAGQFAIYEDDVPLEITSLRTTEIPLVNALLIDNSRSLRAQLGKVIEAGKILNSSNREQDSTAVVRFISSDKIEVVQDFTGNKNSIGNALDNLYVEGGQTAIIDAVYKTARKVSQYQIAGSKEDTRVRAVIVVSDGDDRGSSYTEQQLFDLLRSLDVQIYAIGFPNDLGAEPDENGVSRRDKAKSFLEELARETGGKVYFPSSIDELPRIALEISDELRTQYQLSYIPSAETGRGTFKRINVKIAEGANKEKRTAIARAGRTTAP